MTWPVRATRVVYENPWIRVREDAVTRPDGSDGIFGVVEVQRPAVFVVALTDEDEIVLVTVDRHTVGPSVEVPAAAPTARTPSSPRGASSPRRPGSSRASGARSGP